MTSTKNFMQRGTRISDHAPTWKACTIKRKKNKEIHAWRGEKNIRRGKRNNTAPKGTEMRRSGDGEKHDDSPNKHVINLYGFYSLSHYSFIISILWYKQQDQNIYEFNNKTT